MTIPPSTGLSDLHFGAAVHAVEGRKVGVLHRVIVDDDLTGLRDLVVSETRRFTGSIFSPGTPVLVNDVVVSMSIVSAVARERIDLTISADEVRVLPPYIHWRYAEFTDDSLSLNGIAVAVGGVTTPQLERWFAKSRDALEIQAGENVMLGRTGDRLGTVRDVLFDGTTVVSVVVHPSGFFTQDVLLPVRLLTRSDDLALITTLTREDVEHLTPFEPEPD